ncbi:hypothetical protein [Myroides phaeus]|uniref:Uncharacterized protein n=1 Tax=Myroides phaeus TaxID=702745 RepID=A0A1G8E519_9FLAO|nr:hypothetical protein [Myroides phaeus]MEC4115656.1 hypothetical protein [Myroides phaeus]SDH64981.1 hypothetical protein SAMN05421818_10967 [Myroides phaeus]
MDNPFKKILQDEKLPDYLKDRVIDNLNFIKLSLDMSELYTVKIPQTIQSLMGEKDTKRENEIIEKIKNSKNDGTL